MSKRQCSEVSNPDLRGELHPAGVEDATERLAADVGGDVLLEPVPGRRFGAKHLPWRCVIISNSLAIISKVRVFGNFQEK